MRAGRYRHRVTIQRPVEVQAGSGDVTQTWADLATVWARITPARGEKYLAAQQIDDAQAVAFRIRYRLGIRPNQRLKYSPEPGLYKLYDVVDVLEINERRREIEMMCRLRGSDGFRNEK